MTQVPYCIVCGRGSGRVSWNNTITVGANTYVACDFHSIADFQAAVANLTNQPGPDETNQDPSVDESQAC